MQEIIGREAELHAVDEALDRANDGLSLLLLRGEAGIGKSTIWSEVVRRAERRGWLTLTARAAAAEAPLTLATLADLLEPLGPGAGDDLPAPQRAAFAAALLQAQPEHGSLEPRALAAGVRSVLDRLAAAGPIVVAIDDVQWVDSGSSAVLGFALRRLAGARIAIVLAHRTGTLSPIDPALFGTPERRTVLDLGGLTLAGIHELLKRRMGAVLPRSTLVRILDVSAGSPLFALEIARRLEETGLPRPGDPLPVPGDVESLLRARVRGLGRSTRETLLLVAAHGPIATELLERGLGRPVDDDLLRADEAGIAEERAGEVVFRHPLYAAAILASARPADRRAAHLRLAALVEPGEERARHRALAAESTDPEIASELEAAARAAAGRAAPAAAAELLQLAVQLTPPDDARAIDTRSLELAAVVQRAGELERAAAILEDVVERTRIADVRGRARLALAAIRYETDATSAALELAEAAIEDASDDPALRARALAAAAAVDWEDYARRNRRIDEADRLLATLAEPDPAVVGIVLMERIGQDHDAGRPMAADMIERALDAERRAPPRNVSERFSAALGVWRKYRDEFGAARDWMERSHQAAVDEGDEGSLPYVLSHLPELELWTGNWARARVLAEAHLEIAVELGLEAQRRQATYNVGLVAVHQGRVEDAHAAIDEVLAAAAADGDSWTLSSLEPLLGMLDLSLGDPAAAATHLRAASRIREDMGQLMPRRFDGDLVEALLGIGELAEAQAAGAAMSRRAARFGVHSALANAARSRALISSATGDADAAIVEIDEALAEHSLGLIPFDRARTLLALGRIRRRRRERSAAAAAFGEALAGFVALGARTWADRARDELDRVHLRRTAGDELTDGERRVAELVASGMTNREVAAALFMSPKTVEANLARAYSKLGIRNRAQLGALLARPS